MQTVGVRKTSARPINEFDGTWGSMNDHLENVKDADDQILHARLHAVRSSRKRLVGGAGINQSGFLCKALFIQKCCTIKKTIHDPPTSLRTHTQSLLKVKTV